jgi:hypothetical protein
MLYKLLLYRQEALDMLNWAEDKGKKKHVQNRRSVVVDDHQICSPFSNFKAGGNASAFTPKLCWIVA